LLRVSFWGFWNGSINDSRLPLAVGRSAIEFARSLAAGGNFTPLMGGRAAPARTPPNGGEK
jgi:hypothetical protein